MSQMGEKEVKSMISKGASLYHGTLDEKYALYVPYGHVVVERSMDRNNFLGVRFSGLLPSSSLQKALCNARIGKELAKSDTSMIDQMIKEASLAQYLLAATLSFESL